MISSETCFAKVSEDGKSGMSVHEHCRIVGAVTRELIKRLPSCVSQLFPEYTSLVAALHDVGKISPGFQVKISKSHAEDIAPDLKGHGGGFEQSHANIGQSAVNRFLDERFRIADAALIIGAHHGCWNVNTPLTDNTSDCGGETWSKARSDLIEKLTSEFGGLKKESFNSVIRYLIAGVVTVSDWLGSDENFFSPGGLPEKNSNLSSMVNELLEKSGWTFPRVRANLKFEEIFVGKRLRPVQQEFVESVSGPGLYILEAPMGIGKTEAALYAAYRLMAEGHNYGLYFGLPTRLTSDKIHERVEPFLEQICQDKTHARLAHGHAWLKEFECGGKAFKPYGAYCDPKTLEKDEAKTSWFNPKKRALLWPFAVGTIDQALLSAVRVKHHFVRLFGLAGKVVVLDEVHSYDIYTGSLINMLIDFLLQLNCSVIVLSATLSGKRREELLPGSLKQTAYPLITRRVKSKIDFVECSRVENQIYNVSLADMQAGEVAAEAVREAANGCCVLCIANTVGKSQVWYDAVRAAMPEGQFEVGLIHSKFPAFRREELELEWLSKLGGSPENRPKGCVLVATQVVEQSVDIDADYLITELAPTDMLLQRMGRVWRHFQSGRPMDKPFVKIICGNPEKMSDVDGIKSALGKASSHIYQPYMLWRSWRVWKNISSVSLPDDIRMLIEDTYEPRAEDEPPGIAEMKTHLERWKEKLLKHAISAGVEVYLPPDDEDVCTRYSDHPSQDVLLVKKVVTDGKSATLELLDGNISLCLERDKRDLSAAKRLHRHIVSVPRYIFKSLGFPKMPSWLSMHFHAPVPVWELPDELGPLIMNGVETGYTYDKLRGLCRRSTSIAGSRHFDEIEDYDPFEGEEL